MQRLITLCLLNLLVIVTFITCQKQIALHQTSNSIALGTLKDSSGDCSIDSVEGIFYNGIPPGNNICFVQLKVNITDTGGYIIYTDSANGFGFADTGFFHETGIHTIQLQPVGTPRLHDTTNFVVRFNDDSCFFFVPVHDSTGTNYYDLTKDAKGTMKNIYGDCSPIEVFGKCYKDIPLGDTNYIRVSVNITAPGNFKISTDTVNGFYFNMQQTVAYPGIHTFDLKGHGTPLHIETSALSVNFNGESCPVNVEVKDSSERIILKPAVYKFIEPCQIDWFHINHQLSMRTSLTYDNTISIQVNVLNVGNGNYNLGTETQNGVGYSTAGTFTTTGIQNVTLHGHGAPERAGYTNLPITIYSDSGNSSCNVSLVVAELPDYDTSLNSWKFYEGSNYYTGIFTYPDVVFKENISNTGKELILHGTDVWNEIDTVINIIIQFPESATAPIPGTYITDPHTDHTSVNEFNFKKINPESFIYTSKDASANQETGLTITITSCDADRRIVQGTFNGQLFDKEGNVVNATNGKFRAGY